MKTIIAFGLVVLAAASSPAFADAANDPLCGPDAPEGYKRAGGWCEIAYSGSSTSGHSSASDPDAASGGGATGKKAQGETP